MLRKKMLLIFNPKAGTELFAPNLFEVVDHFTKSGYEVTAYPTQSSGDAYTITLERSGDFDILVCSGGDGTLSETVNALMACERRPVVGYIPAGTTNDFATSLGLPKDVLDAARVITDGEPHCLDIGRFGDRYFSYVAAFGLFTDVSYATQQSTKNVLGHLAYLWEGFKRLGSIKSYRCTIDLGTEVLSGEYVFGMVANSLSVGGFKIPTDGETYMDDGLFEIALLEMPANFMALQKITVKLLSQDPTFDSLVMRRASKITVTSQKPLAWTLDGEFGGDLTSIEIGNCHNAIKIMLP